LKFKGLKTSRVKKKRKEKFEEEEEEAPTNEQTPRIYVTEFESELILLHYFRAAAS
jgi:hypothetical protein